MSATAPFRVLVASDGLEAASEGLRLIAGLGNPASIDVTVVSVATSTHGRIDESALVAGDVPGMPASDPSRHDGDRRHLTAGDVAEAATAHLRQAGFDARPWTLAGHPGRQVVEEIESGGYGLVVIGAGRHTWLGSVLLGSTSNFVLHNATASVLIVHATPPDGRYRVLVATDGSEGSAAAIHAYTRFAAADRCALTVLSIADLPLVATAFPYSSEGEPILDVRREQVATLARAEAERLASAGFAATPMTAEGPPAVTILGQAASSRVDLVVMGSRGLGPVGRALLGSVSDAVSRHAPATLVGRG